MKKRIFKHVSQREGQGFSQQTQMLSAAIMKEPQPYMNKALNNEKLGGHSSVNDSGKAAIMLPQPYLSNDPFRRPVFPNHMEFPESELNEDILNRQLIMLHGQDIEHQHISQGKVSALPVGEALVFSNSSLPVGSLVKVKAHSIAIKIILPLRLQSFQARMGRER